MNIAPPFTVITWSEIGPTTRTGTADEICWLVINRHKEGVIMAKKEEDAKLFCRLLNKEYVK